MNQTTQPANAESTEAALHTPGPWMLEQTSTEAVHVISRAVSSGIRLATVMPCINGCVKANAALIASAPDLLESLGALMNRFAAEFETLTDGSWDVNDFAEVQRARNLLKLLA